MGGEQQSRFHATFCTEQQNPRLVDELYKLRKVLFVDILKWDLQTVDDCERDQFDTSAAVHCALFRNDELIGGFRAIRTDHDYLVRSVFPHLAAVKRFPQRVDIWEISRFGVLPIEDRLEIAKLNYALMFRFAHMRRAAALVALVDLTYERFLKKLGIRTRRYGPPQIVGTKTTGEPMWCVAGEIPLAEQNGSRFQALLALAKKVEIKDAAPVFGRIRVSA
jgi:N-acyl-L-homoserine lactone synthetase